MWHKAEWMGRPIHAFLKGICAKVKYKQHPYTMHLSSEYKYSNFL